MDKLENWTEVTKGIYRYVMAANCCYEIHIMYHAKDTDILTANVSLYIVGDWTTSNGYCSYFERELLLNGPLMACLEKAMEDSKKKKMSKSLCHDCIHNCTDRKHGSFVNHNGIWCNAEYGRVINKKVKGCKNYIRKENHDGRIF